VGNFRRRTGLQQAPNASVPGCTPASGRPGRWSLPRSGACTSSKPGAPTTVSAQLRQACATPTAKHATPGRFRPRGEEITPFLPPARKGPQAPSARSARGRLSHLIKQKTYKRVLWTCPPRWAAHEGGESPSFSSSFPWEQHATSAVVRWRSLSTTLFPSPQAYPAKFGMTHVFRKC
jgi:hypothetical protein